MGKHTPGPWSLTVEQEGHTTKDGVVILCAAVYPALEPGEFRGPITHLQSCNHIEDGITREECEANARLIAAAPELLHELRELAELAHNMLTVPDSVWAAIAKAEGA